MGYLWPIACYSCLIPVSPFRLLLGSFRALRDSFLILPFDQDTIINHQPSIFFIYALDLNYIFIGISFDRTCP